jgi:hypothetical protein
MVCKHPVIRVFLASLITNVGLGVSAPAQIPVDCPPVVVPRLCPPSELIGAPNPLPSAPANTPVQSAQTPTPTSVPPISDAQPAAPDAMPQQANSANANPTSNLDQGNSGLLGAESRFAALASSTTSLPIGRGGYIDNAVPANMVRFRYDAGFDFQNPFRATFFYPAFSPLDNGPSRNELSLDYQEASVYGEARLGRNLSVFAEVPFRFIDANLALNTSGLSDVSAGMKAVLARSECDDFILSALLRVYAQTGDVPDGLGTGHASLEPGILLYRRLSDQTALEGEVRYWIPLEDNPVASEVVRYGVGINTEIARSCNWDLRGVFEVVGWTVLDGVLPVPGTQDLVDAGGATIVNLKPGVRLNFGACRNQSLYVGYGRAITGPTWYQDLVRVEYRVQF